MKRVRAVTPPWHQRPTTSNAAFATAFDSDFNMLRSIGAMELLYGIGPTEAFLWTPASPVSVEGMIASLEFIAA